MAYKTVCRLCSSKEEIFEVFHPQLDNGEQLRLSILLATGIEIKKTDQISKMVCRRCCEIAVKLHQYRTKAVANDKLLKENANLPYNSPILDQNELLLAAKSLYDSLYVENIPVKTEVVQQANEVPSKDVLEDEIVAPPVSEPQNIPKAEWKHPSVQEIHDKYTNIVLPKKVFKSDLSPVIFIDSTEVSEWYAKQLRAIEQRLPNINIKRVGAPQAPRKTVSSSPAVPTATRCTTNSSTTPGSTKTVALTNLIFPTPLPLTRRKSLSDLISASLTETALAKTRSWSSLSSLDIEFSLKVVSSSLSAETVLINAESLSSLSSIDTDLTTPVLATIQTDTTTSRLLTKTVSTRTVSSIDIESATRSVPTRIQTPVDTVSTTVLPASTKTASTSSVSSIDIECAAPSVPAEIEIPILPRLAETTRSSSSLSSMDIEFTAPSVPVEIEIPFLPRLDETTRSSIDTEFATSSVPTKIQPSTNTTCSSLLDKTNSGSARSLSSIGIHTKKQRRCSTDGNNVVDNSTKLAYSSSSSRTASSTSLSSTGSVSTLSSLTVTESSSPIYSKPLASTRTVSSPQKSSVKKYRMKRNYRRIVDSSDSDDNQDFRHPPKTPKKENNNTFSTETVSTNQQDTLESITILSSDEEFKSRNENVSNETENNKNAVIPKTIEKVSIKITLLDKKKSNSSSPAQQVEVPDTFLCRSCNKLYDTAEELLNHENTHLRCKFCKKKLKNVELLRQHQNEMCHVNIINNQPVIELIKVDTISSILEKYSNAFHPEKQTSPTVPHGDNVDEYIDYSELRLNIEKATKEISIEVEESIANQYFTLLDDFEKHTELEFNANEANRPPRTTQLIEKETINSIFTKYYSNSTSKRENDMQTNLSFNKKLSFQHANGSIQVCNMVNVLLSLQVPIEFVAHPYITAQFNRNPITETPTFAYNWGHKKVVDIERQSPIIQLLTNPAPQNLYPNILPKAQPNCPTTSMIRPPSQNLGKLFTNAIVSGQPPIPVVTPQLAPQQQMMFKQITPPIPSTSYPIPPVSIVNQTLAVENNQDNVLYEQPDQVFYNNQNVNVNNYFMFPQNQSASINRGVPYVHNTYTVPLPPYEQHRQNLRFENPQQPINVVPLTKSIPPNSTNTMLRVRNINELS